MLRNRAAVRSVAAEIERAADDGFEAYLDDNTSYEPDITGRILGAIDTRMKDYRSKGIVWKSATAKPFRGQGAEEKRTGSDFLGVLDIDIESFSVKKGFLAQAKRMEPTKVIPEAEWARLRKQCSDMLNITPESYLFVYSRRCGIRVFPAMSTVNLTTRNIFDIYSRSLSRFFEDHISSFIGDDRFKVPSFQELERVAREYRVSNALYLGAREDSE